VPQITALHDAPAHASGAVLIQILLCNCRIEQARIEIHFAAIFSAIGMILVHRRACGLTYIAGVGTMVGVSTSLGEAPA
jgi:hypothetical protein